MVRVDFLLAVLAAAIYGRVALFMVFNGALNIDEGFYGLSARAAVSGSLPYRDFGYTQMPLFPYICGAFMRVIGFGFVKQRLVSGIWAALTVALGTAWLWRRQGRLAGLGYFALMVSGLQWMYFAHLGKTNGLVGLLVLATVVVLDARPRAGLQIFAVSLLGVLAVGCRLPVAPFFLVVWVGLVARHFSLRTLGWAVFWPGVLMLVLVAPFVAESPRSFWFWVVDFHRQSRVVKDWHIDPRALFPLAPALCLVWVVFSAGLVARRISVGKPLDVALLAMFTALACDILPPGAYPEYAAPLVPSFLFVLVALLVGTALPTAWRVVSLAACVLLNLTVRAPLDRAVLGETRKAAAYVRQFQGGAVPFAGSASIIALEAGTPVDGRMIMAPFCCSESYPDAEAAKLHLITPDEVARLMADPRSNVLVMFSDPVRNLVFSMPAFTLISEGATGRWKSILAQDYALEYGDPTFAVFIRRSLYNSGPTTAHAAEQ